jgi:ferredoxin
MSLDNIISAIGQRPELPASLDIETTKWDTLEVDSGTMATKKTGIFAGGDDVLGPATVIEAIAAGRQAAISIDKYLGGNGDITEILSPPETIDQVEEPAEGLRPEILGISREQRISFDEVEVGWDSESAVAETRRCLRCDLTCQVEKYELNSGRCIYCGLCVESCPFDALYMGRGYERGTYRLGELILNKEDLLAPDKRKPSAYFHPELEETLPKQSLLIDRDKEKNNGY